MENNPEEGPKNISEQKEGGKPKHETFDKTPQESKKPSPQVEISRNLGGADLVELVDSQGAKVGQAEARLITEPGFLSATEIQIKEEDEALATETVGDMENAKATDLEGHILDDHINAALHVVFYRFHSAGYGDVFEAENVNFGNVHSEEQKVEGERNYIIPTSSAERMKALLQETVKVSGGPHIQFNTRPYNLGSSLGEKGFTVSLSVRTATASSHPFEINFLYGKEKAVANEDGEESEQRSDSEEE